ncbi:MAG: GspE/PulE family protein [Planctomycetaceae bacterium]|jgi:type II secretory ATPase GspE/PulE/Tfp pilus assembly ATPase PilB-like protein|nr:GspE/PulE family protein [Planctomycetaceae bacterium]
MTSSEETKVIDLSRIVAGREALRILPAALARRLGVLPIMIANEKLYVVMEDDEDYLILSQLENIVGLPVIAFRAKESGSVSEFIRKYYPEQVSELDGTPLGLLEEIVFRAMLSRSSDIHFDSERDNGYVRLRIDGMMHIDQKLPLANMRELVSAVKVASGLNIAERRVPQDGQLTLWIGGNEVSLRIATVPTLYGEKMTLRILTTERTLAELAELDMLGMNEQHLQMFLDTLESAHGVLLLSGPTGSGKTTTLYAALRHLKKSGTLHILTIEDPVEIPLDGINQIRIDSERVDFNRALRSTLRHDPDVIMIGEIRDAETADIAIKSSLTGHLVLSTLHANDSVGVIARLLNLGVATELVNSALRLVIAQRLVRSPCPHCVQMENPSTIDCEFFGWNNEETLVPKAVGCPLCNQTGYVGRIGLYEMVPIDRTVREMIRNKESEDALSYYLFHDQNLLTLKADGDEKIRKGLTTPEEVRRVVYLSER